MYHWLLFLINNKKVHQVNKNEKALTSPPNKLTKDIDRENANNYVTFKK